MLTRITRIIAVSLLAGLAGAPADAQIVNAPPAPAPEAFDAYNSWKLALGTNRATAAETLTLPPGFTATLVRSAPPAEGSWVSMAFDPAGRLTLAREKRGLLRLELSGTDVRQVEVINDTLLECRGLLYAFGNLYANANNSKVLVRLREHNGQFDDPTELLRTEGGVGHGRNHLKLGPDGFLYLAHGNNVRPPTRLSETSPLRRLAEDQLIPCPWDPSLFDGDVLVPAGHILRLDPEGREVRMVAGGFRNPLDVAFNRDGELFTFDADMEWDVGAPWYMPNRVLHIVSGADYGFRRGTGRFPEYYSDSLPSTLNIGLASPTAVISGAGSQFPPNYRDALFICDWAYGRILTVHLQPEGASYRATSELFVSGRPLNVTDASIGPDGALWFITGGRGTQSGLYRVAYAGTQTTEPARSAAELAQERTCAELRSLRHQLEAYHGDLTPGAEVQTITELWPHLGHDDRWIRHAARVALERQPVSFWRQKALTETDPMRALTAWLALTRVGEPADQAPLLRQLAQLPLSQLSEEQQLTALRVYALAFIRLGAPDPLARAHTLQSLAPLYPARTARLNHELCELLVYLESPAVLAQTLPLLSAAQPSEDLLQYTFFLHYVRAGWTPEAHQLWFAALTRAAALPGARQYFKAIQDLRREMTDRLSPADRTMLAPWLGEDRKPSAPIRAASLVKDWRMTDLAPALERVSRGRSLDSGRAALVRAQCVLCHRVSADPALPAGVLGPDLTAVASRFNQRDLLEHILDPSKVIDEKFRQITFSLRDGSEITGTLEVEDAKKVSVRSNPLSLDLTDLPKEKILRRTVSAVSPMPTGLLNVLTLEQVLDLLAFFEAGGNPASPLYAPAAPGR